MKKNLLAALFAASALCSCTQTEKIQEAKPRVIVTCDPELDDHNSLIRYLLFSTDFDTEGLIYASSQFHWKGDGKGGTQYIEGREYSSKDRQLGPQTHWRWGENERFIDEDVEAYEKVYPNLKVHHPGYPSPEYLKSIIREGNVAFEGDISADTPGSDLIKKVLLDDDMRPVFIQVWGGPSTASRALKSIQEEYEGTPEWESIKAKVSAKAKFCLSGEQDASYREYVRPNWPDVESVILNAGVISLGYGASFAVVNPSDTLYYSPEWMLANIKNKGMLGEMYRVWGDGKQMVPGDFTDYFGFRDKTAEELKAEGYWVWTQPRPFGTFLSEGDTPMYLNLIGNGLRAYEGQEYGGWAGRRKEVTAQEKAGSSAPYAMRAAKDAVLPSFVPEVQNSLAARLSWSVTSDFSAVNHEPSVKGPEKISAKPGSTVKVKAAVSDPDNDSLTYSWDQYKVGSYKGDVLIEPSDRQSAASVTVPADAKPGDTVHIILTVRDDGAPALTSYLRTVITVK